jgi:hypothetical protein
LKDLQPRVKQMCTPASCAGEIGVVLSATLERKYRNGIGLGAAAAVGVGTLVDAHALAPGGGAPAAEALDAGFWLAAGVMLLTLRSGRRRHQRPLAGWIARMAATPLAASSVFRQMRL